MENAIAAARNLAGVRAVVARVTVAVIAALTLLDHAIAAACRLTVVARVGWVIVAVIAAFTRPKNTIAAARLETVGEAIIRIVLVAIVAGFVTWITDL